MLLVLRGKVVRWLRVHYTNIRLTLSIVGDYTFNRMLVVVVLTRGSDRIQFNVMPLARLLLHVIQSNMRCLASVVKLLRYCGPIVRGNCRHCGGCHNMLLVRCWPVHDRLR